jgi:Zn-dependent peptidase ImmA (M78 family)
VSVLKSHLASVDDLNAFSFKTGLSSDRLEALVNGDDPTLGEIRMISDALKLPISALVLPPSTNEQTKILFRQAGVLGKQVQNATVEQLSAKLDASRLFFGSQPPPWNLAWKSEFINQNQSLQEAHENAGRFRKIFFNDDQMGPIHSLPKIVTERMGVLVFVTRSSDFDGASALVDGVAFAFVSARFRPRMLFTLAHEVGHLIAHHNVSEPFAIVDEDVESGMTNSTDQEQYANSFASALLMPSQGFALALKKIRQVSDTNDQQIGDIEINLLSRIYGVSFWAAALRCEALKLIPRGGAAALQDHVSKAHGSPEKRGEAVGLPPRPDIVFSSVPKSLLQSAVIKIKNGEISLGRAAALLELSIADLMAENVPVAH